MAQNPNKLAAAISSGVKAITQGVSKLRNTDNISGQVGREDLAKPDDAPGGANDIAATQIDRDKLVKLGDEWYEEARIGRSEHHEQFFTGLAFYAGKQNHFWNQEAGGGDGLMQPFPGSGGGNPDMAEKFIHKQENLIRVYAERAVARICAAYPDAWAAPLTDSDTDKLAAQVARSVIAHCVRETGLAAILRDATLDAVLTTTVFIETGWDNKAECDFGIPQTDGSVQYHRVQGGDVRCSELLAIDCYPDPNAGATGRGIHGGDYFIKRTLHSVTDVENKWGIKVSPTAPGATYSYLRQRLEYIAGDHSRILSRMKNSTEVTSVWNKPSPEYPDGRYWVYSGDKTILHAGKWPYERMDRYPFEEIYIAKNAGSVWHLNLVADAIDPQRTLNRLATYLAGRLEWDRPTNFVRDDSDIVPDDVLNPAYGKVTAYNGNSRAGPPVWTFPPPPGSFYFDLERSLLNKIELIFGVHDFNSDTANQPSSGFEYELRMQEDKSRLGPIVQRNCEAVVEIYKWFIALNMQFGAAFPRLLGLDDKAVPTRELQGQGAAATALTDMKALRNGNCRVLLQPGSGQGKLPAAQEEELQGLIKTAANLAPPLVELYVTQSNVIRNDVVKDRFIHDYAAYMAQEQQQAQQIQQMKGNQAQQQNQQKAEQEQQAAQIVLQADQEKSAIAVHASSLEQQWRLQTDMATNQQKFEQSMALLQAKGATPTVTLAGKLGPVGTASAEEAANLKPDDPATMKALLMPPKPAAPAVAGRTPAKPKAK